MFVHSVTNRMPDWIARLPRPLGFVERNPPVFPIHIVVEQHAMVGDKLNGQYLELICRACSRRRHADRRALARLNRIVSPLRPRQPPMYGLASFHLVHLLYLWHEAYNRGLCIVKQR